MSPAQGTSHVPPREAQRNIELMPRGASAALPGAEALESLALGTGSLHADTAASTRTFAQRASEAANLHSRRQSLQTREAKVKQSLAKLEGFNAPMSALWNRYFDANRKYYSDVAWAVGAAVTVLGFPFTIAFGAAAIEIARGMRDLKATIDAGGVGPQKTTLEIQLDDIRAQLNEIDERLNAA